jgi:hypothetical protein
MLHHAANSMAIPHCFEKSRTVSLPVENQDEPAQAWVLFELLLAGLMRNILQQPRNDVVSQRGQQSLSYLPVIPGFT